ncbi:methyltransferase type 11 [Podospora didyma]|uniref:Methyltransferase type 11 n=1 Tax=Podospora didyma TaxID=330526 RepID=A0AAE0N3B5_9PEZI|nr:methyltransferase type 11 [Podospora didyma]
MSSPKPELTSQYDAFGQKYTNVFKAMPTAALETANLRAILTPYLVPDSRVLDLACGTGYFPRLYLQWGAASVVGVDVSPVMVAAARQQQQTSSSSSEMEKENLQFQVGNALSLGPLPEGPFDVVTGNWLLNYAGTEAEMTQMFASIAANLRPGGVFVGITPPMVDQKDMDAVVAETKDLYRDERRAAVLGYRITYLHRVDEGGLHGGGWEVELSAGRDEDEKVTFRTFRFPRAVYEEGARRGGMKGRLEWCKVEMVPEARAAAGEEFWREYAASEPHMALMVVEKGNE